MMMRVTLLFGSLAALALLPASALADWEENFDSYQNGSSMHGQGGWKGWDDDPAYTAYVTDVQARSDPHSVDVVGDTDLVHEYSGYTSGQWTYTAWQYIPSEFEGTTYFILLSDYEDGAGQDNQWAVQISFDSTDQVIWSEYDYDPNDPNEPITLPLITDRWVELRTEIDLDTDWFDFYYDGELLIGKAWTATPNNDDGGFLVIDGVDLYANAATSAYYDDMSLKPVGGCPGDIDGDGDTDHSDLGALLAAWCTHAGDPNWNPNADLDGDGHVGHGDLGILLADWGCGVP
jgi:hypothetical protein